jgi:hypothetical protein
MGALAHFFSQLLGRFKDEQISNMISVDPAVVTRGSLSLANRKDAP